MKKLFIIFLLLLLVGCNESKKEVKKEIKEQKEEKRVLTIEDYNNMGINELGNIPIMMYHGIHNKKNSDTEYTGGNVDRDGYQRTSEAFRNDLEFYYNNGYRMIRLNDYIDGNIDTEAGKSPIVLTFDDGLSNNIKVTGLDKNGNIVIDPNSAVGILEEYKSKYPDFNVTATFFINSALFNQPDYNKEIIEWLIDHGYDIGNHTYSHVDFSKVDNDKTMEEVGSMYNILDKYTNKYINVIALPFGSPYNINHPNIESILKSTYGGKTYNTKAMLRVGWCSEESPFSKNFNPQFLKRIRAYDNNGNDFDIEMNFNILKNTKYISDGDPNTIVVKESEKNNISSLYNKKIVTY